MLLLGWEMTLAAYSYCWDTRKCEKRFVNYVKFVLVNPTLVYSRRGKRVADAGLNGAGLRRALVGMGCLGLSAALGPLIGTTFQDRTSMLASATVAPLRLAQVYLAFTGLADLQVGLMRQLGYVVPERYDHVLRARSPREFWRRWNTYVGAWARLYVFQPLAGAVSKRLAPNTVAKKLAYGMILFITFAVVGALHDAYAMASSMRLTVQTTQWFCVNALVMFAWDVVSSAVLRSRSRRSNWFHNAAPRLGVFALAMVFVTWFP
jgi:hypothetical protein